MRFSFVVLTGAAATACTGRDPAPSLLERITADRAATGGDTVEVWVCDVPGGTTDPTYGELTLRLDLTPGNVVAAIGDGVGDYFTTLSHGAYRPELVAGGVVHMAVTDTSDDCLDAALDRSSPTADAVLGVATAEHVAGSPGGWGRPGTWLTCSGTCPASLTRRAAYIGASDFSFTIDGAPPRDLVEHELGHSLGLPHSGAGDDKGYPSALDVMSNSAAPRDVDLTRVDAPDTLGIDRVDLGWLALGDVAIVPPDGAVIELAPSAAGAGTRLAVIELDTATVITIELLTPTGFDAHLPAAGVAVHRVDASEGADVLRVQQVLGSDPPHTDLLDVGESLESDGWRIEVASPDVGPSGPTARVAVSATAG